MNNQADFSDGQGNKDPSKDRRTAIAGAELRAGDKPELSVECRRVLDNKPGYLSGKGTPDRENAAGTQGNGGASLENADDTCPAICPGRAALFRVLRLTPAGFCREHAFRRILGDVIDKMQEEVF